jgi:hypothetical protein
MKIILLKLKKIFILNQIFFGLTMIFDYTKHQKIEKNVFHKKKIMPKQTKPIYVYIYKIKTRRWESSHLFWPNWYG